MKKYIILLSAAIALQLNAAEKLTGTPICSGPSVDYATGQPSTTVHTVETLFDGDLNTYFAAYQRSYAWAGLDLGIPHVIERVGWAPRNDYSEGENRVKMAVIQGANSPDWLDAVPLFIITEKGTFNEMTYGDVNCSKGFRYVRYVSPSDVRCNLAELEFYGHEGEGDDSHMFQFTQLPTVCINTVDSKEPFDKETDIVGNVIILDGNGYNVDASATVRERGNSSRTHPKKPWRIKFDSKQKVLDAPAKAKKWTLINNHSDKTLMRNIVAFEISRRMRLGYTPYCQPVDVVLNGEFKGCYQLCDQVEAKKGRVPVTEMEPTDIEGEALSGGYHIEIDSYANLEPEGTWFESTHHQMPVTIKSPDDGGTPEQFAYIKDYFSELEKRVFTSRTYNDEVKGYRAMLDVDMYLRYFIVEEIIGNADAVWSMHMYKERGNDKFTAGPVWDSELAFDNDHRVYPTNDLSTLCTLSGRGPIANNFLEFHKRIFSIDSKAVRRRNFLYSVARNENDLTGQSLCDYVDYWAEQIKPSADLNFKRWNVLGQYIFTNPRAELSFEEAVDNLKTYLLDRIDRLDNEKFFKYDPEAASIDLPQADAADSSQLGVTVSGNTVALADGEATFSVTSADGRLCFRGKGASTPLAPGIYIVTSGPASVKVAI